MTLRVLWLVLALPSLSFGQIIHQPLDEPLRVSGALAELRNHHFHSGVDLRTGGATGKNVYAVADGWVRRIVIRSDGYGWALYLDHPSGHTSVYGHLESFSREIWDYVRREAQRTDSYRLDLALPRDLIPVRAGQVIAASGNSGSSGGPHLHFEWRDQSSEHILDPTAFGLRIPEPTSRPKLWYRDQGRWRTAGDSIAVDTWYDLAITLPEQGFVVTVRDSSRAQWQLPRWSFEVQRGADAGLALDLHRQHGVRAWILHPTPTQPAPGWQQQRPWPTQPGRYQVEVVSQNHRVWQGVVAVRQPSVAVPSGATTIQSGPWTLDVPARAFAHHVALRADGVGRSIKITPDAAAIKPVTYTWTPSDLNEGLHAKTYLAVRDGRGASKIPGTPLADGRIQFVSKTCGNAEVRVDDRGPTCALQRRDASGNAYILVKDDLDVHIVRARVGGAWVWAYLDAKTNTLRVSPEGRKGLLELTVQDELGNRTTFTANL